MKFSGNHLYDVTEIFFYQNSNWKTSEKNFFPFPDKFDFFSEKIRVECEVFMALMKCLLIDKKTNF